MTDTQNEKSRNWLVIIAVDGYTAAARDFVKTQGEFITYSTMLSRMKIIDDQLADVSEVTTKASRGLEKVVKDTHKDLVWSGHRLIAESDRMLELGLPVDEALIAMAADIITNA